MTNKTDELLDALEERTKERVRRHGKNGIIEDVAVFDCISLIRLVKAQREALEKADLELRAFAEVSAHETIQKALALSVEDLE